MQAGQQINKKKLVIILYTVLVMILCKQVNKILAIILYIYIYIILVMILCKQVNRSIKYWQ